MSEEKKNPPPETEVPDIGPTEMLRIKLSATEELIHYIVLTKRFAAVFDEIKFIHMQLLAAYKEHSGAPQILGADGSPAIINKDRQ